MHDWCTDFIDAFWKYWVTYLALLIFHIPGIGMVPIHVAMVPLQTHFQSSKGSIECLRYSCLGDLLYIVDWVITHIHTHTHAHRLIVNTKNPAVLSQFNIEVIWEYSSTSVSVKTLHFISNTNALHHARLLACIKAEFQNAFKVSQPHKLHLCRI